jgi:hypothetical protein
MFDNARMLDVLERTLDRDPFCPVCSAPTAIEDDGGRLWLVCSATANPTGFLGRLGAAFLPHPRRLVLDLTEYLAA